MKKEKIEWCLCQKRGIKLIEPKPHLSKSYMEEADETLGTVILTKGKWKTITAYYACYNALYSLLMKCGIKSEIHECSIELMGLFGFNEDEEQYLKKLKDDRIKAQYYLKNIILEDQKPVKEFVHRCKVNLESLDSKKIEEIRKRLKKR